MIIVVRLKTTSMTGYACPIIEREALGRVSSVEKILVDYQYGIGRVWRRVYPCRGAAKRHGQCCLPHQVQ